MRKRLLSEQLPNHQHRNLKAFEERIQKQIYVCMYRDRMIIIKLIWVRGSGGLETVHSEESRMQLGSFLESYTVGSFGASFSGTCGCSWLSAGGSA